MAAAASDQGSSTRTQPAVTGPLHWPGWAALASELRTFCTCGPGRRWEPALAGLGQLGRDKMELGAAAVSAALLRLARLPVSHPARPPSEVTLSRDIVRDFGDTKTGS